MSEDSLWPAAPKGSAGECLSVAGRANGSYPEQLFMSLHGMVRPTLGRLFDRRPSLSLELVARAGEISFQIWIPTGHKPFVEAQLRAAYPALELTPVGERPSSGASFGVAELGLAQGNHLPIRTAFDTEPLANVLWTLAGVPVDQEVRLQILVRPKTSRWQVQGQLEAQRLRDGRRGWEGLLPGVPGQVTPNQFEKARAKAIEEKATGVGFDCVLRVAVAADSAARVREYLRTIVASLAPYAAANGFCVRRVAFDLRSRERFERREFPRFGSLILTARELAALWHLPSDGPPQLQLARAARLAPPRNASRGERLLGQSTWGDEDRPIGLSLADSRLHLHLLGPTGTGKTTALLNLAVQDVTAGRGVGVLDPKGDLVRGVLERLPRGRLDEVVLISPEESDFSVGINPLELGTADDADLVAENTLTIFKRIYERFWGMRTDDVLKAALRTLLRRTGTTLAHVPLLLTDGDFRLDATTELNDIGLSSFWRWYEQLSDSQRLEAIGPVLNKLRDFLIRPRLRRLLCQPRSTVDLRDVVDSGKILLADLSVGQWGQSAAELIGSFLVAKLWQAVLARSARAEDGRRDFFLYLDEFQHFQGIGGPFAEALAEARSLRLSLTIANQHLGQLPGELRHAISSNARSRAVFQCGQDDASYLAREFAPLDASALLSLRRFEMAVRLSISGETSPPFTLRTLAPTEVRDGSVAAHARAASLRRHGRPSADVDAELEAALKPWDTATVPGEGLTPAHEART